MHECSAVVAGKFCINDDQSFIVADQSFIVADQSCIVSDQSCIVADQSCIVESIVILQSYHVTGH